MSKGDNKMFKVVVSTYTCVHTSAFSFTVKKFKRLKAAQNWVKKNKNKYYKIRIKKGI